MVQLSLDLTLARIRLAFILVKFFRKLTCCSSASDNTRENMHANKLTGEASTYIVPCIQLGCFTLNTCLNTRENMQANKLTGEIHTYTVPHVHF